MLGLDDAEMRLYIDKIDALLCDGQTADALACARKALNGDCLNPWLQALFFWAMHDACIEALQTNDMDKVEKCCREMARLLPTMADVTSLQYANLSKRGDGYAAYFRLLDRIRPQSVQVNRLLLQLDKEPDTVYEEVRKEIITYGCDADASQKHDMGRVLYAFLQKRKSFLSQEKVDEVLWLYLSMQGDVPSELHSRMLRFASIYTFSHPTFSFIQYLKAWGTDNLQDSDWETTPEAPSLISEVCRAWLVSYIQGGQASCRFSDIMNVIACSYERENQLYDCLREPFYWYLYNLWNCGKKTECLHAFSFYFEHLAMGQSSLWQSRVIELALEYMRDEHARQFVVFMMRCGNAAFSEDDWCGIPNTSFAPLAYTVARRCYAIVKACSWREREVLDFLLSVYYELLGRGYSNSDVLTDLAFIHYWNGDLVCSQYICCGLLLLQPSSNVLWCLLAKVATDERLKELCVQQTERLEKRLQFDNKTVLDTLNRCRSVWSSAVHSDDLAREVSEGHQSELVGSDTWTHLVCLSFAWFKKLFGR